MTIDVAPAQWKKENNNYLVKRMGYILISFFEVEEDYRIDGATKKAFVMTAKNLDVILDLDPRAPYDSADSNEELLLYKGMNSALTNILKVTKNTDRTYTFTYCETGDLEDDVQSYNEICIKPG